MKRLLTTLVALLLVGGSVAASGGTAQILRPEGDGAVEILVVDRVARMRLALPVSPEVAFDAWTVSGQLVEWLPHWVEMQVAEGAGFTMGWDGYDGEWSGTYLEVERPERLVFTWVVPDGVFPSGVNETVVTLTFEEVEDGRTSLLLEHSGFGDAAELESQLEAWRGYLFALRAHLLRPTGD
jgi:uncharacterized protein YndB with AHSA1/START domain